MVIRPKRERTSKSASQFGMFVHPQVARSRNYASANRLPQCEQNNPPPPLYLPQAAHRTEGIATMALLLASLLVHAQTSATTQPSTVQPRKRFNNGFVQI